MAAKSLSPRGAGLAVALPLVLFFGLVSVGVFAAVVAGGTASCGGGEAVGTLGRGVPKRLVPIYEQAAAKYQLGRAGAVDPRRRSIGSRPDSAPTSASPRLAPKAGCSSCLRAGKPSVLMGMATETRTRTTPGMRSSPPPACFATPALPANWHGAIFSYNHAEWYVEKVSIARGGALRAGVRRRLGGRIRGAARRGRSRQRDRSQALSASSPPGHSSLCRWLSFGSAAARRSR